jgi:hypothetical protein
MGDLRFKDFDIVAALVCNGLNYLKTFTLL